MDEASENAKKLPVRKQYFGVRRPNKLDGKFLRDYEKAVGNGLKPVTAAKALGVTSETFYNWLKRYDEGGDDMPKEIRKFGDITHQVRAQCLAMLMEKAQLAVQTTDDAIKLMRHIAPEEFGRDDEKVSDVTINQVLVTLVRKTLSVRIEGEETGELELPE